MKEQIIERIKQYLDPLADIELQGDDCSLTVIITSDKFVGLNTIKRHRLVNDLMKEDIKNGTLHALSIKTYTPSEKNNK